MTETTTFATTLLSTVSPVEVAGFNEIYGGAGADVIFGGQDSDVIYGGAGDDRISPGGGYDWAYGEQGADKIFESTGGGLLSGGTEDDFILGGEGTDFIQGDQGNDTLIGAGSIDYIYGGIGDDFLNGQAGDDYLIGDAGDDLIYGSTGDDDLEGGAGDDYFEGGEGDDYIEGGAGNDILKGQNGNDSLFGDAGNDSLIGGNGRDGLFGGIDGVDRLEGNAGDDRFLPVAEGISGSPVVIDNVIDKQDEDVELIITNDLTVVGSKIFEGAQWTDEEIKLVDTSLRTLHLHLSDASLLTDSDDTTFTLFKYDNIPEYWGVNFRFLNYIGFGESLLTNFSYFVDDTVFHEFAHNYDELSENPFITQFRAISDWDQTQDAGDTLSLDGRWWYNDTSDDFFRQYGTTNPFEDYATTFAAYFLNEIGKYNYNSETGPTPEKFDNIERLLTYLERRA